eukprot:532824-Rhodomonas_salina.1
MFEINSALNAAVAAASLEQMQSKEAQTRAVIDVIRREEEGFLPDTTVEATLDDGMIMDSLIFV